MTFSGCKASRYHQEIATRGTIYDMDIDASDKLVVTVGQVLLCCYLSVEVMLIVQPKFIWNKWFVFYHLVEVYKGSKIKLNT
jgi:hypothetical protein